MPKQLRWTIKQELDSILNHYDKAGFKMRQLEVIFRDQHPELSQGLEAAIAITAQLHEMVQSFRDRV